MLGSLILYLKGMRTIMFQLSAFYCTSNHYVTFGYGGLVPVLCMMVAAGVVPQPFHILARPHVSVSLRGRFNFIRESYAGWRCFGAPSRQGVLIGFASMAYGRTSHLRDRCFSEVLKWLGNGRVGDSGPILDLGFCTLPHVGGFSKQDPFCGRCRL